MEEEDRKRTGRGPPDLQETIEREREAMRTAIERREEG